MEEGSLRQKMRLVFSQPSRSPEEELLDGARRGEESALEQLFRQHKDRVFSLCLRMTGNYFEAEDLTQESFLQAFRKLQLFRGESSFSTWLYRVTMRVVLDELRRRHPTENLLDIVAAGKEAETLSLGSVAQRDFTLERLRLERAIAALPTGYRVILVLHDIEGYSHEEIAQSLGSQTGSCKSQLHKARRKLRELLGQE